MAAAESPPYLPDANTGDGAGTLAALAEHGGGTQLPVPGRCELGDTALIGGGACGVCTAEECKLPPRTDGGATKSRGLKASFRLSTGGGPGIVNKELPNGAALGAVPATTRGSAARAFAAAVVAVQAAVSAVTAGGGEGERPASAGHMDGGGVMVL